ENEDTTRVPFGVAAIWETMPNSGSIPADRVLRPLSSERTTRLAALPNPMFALHSSATLVDELGTTLSIVSPWSGWQGSGRALQVTPSSVTSSTSADGASSRADGTAR